MSIREHRTGRKKPRRRLPDFVRKAGPHEVKPAPATEEWRESAHKFKNIDLKMVQEYYG